MLGYSVVMPWEFPSECARQVVEGEDRCRNYAAGHLLREDSPQCESWEHMGRRQRKVVETNQGICGVVATRATLDDTPRILT